MKNKTKAFSRLSAAQKRVAIAKDVLKQIRVEQYNIQSGTWLGIEMDTANIAVGITMTPQDTQRFLLGLPIIKPIIEPPKCTCCAIGAACASAVRLGNTHAIQNGQLIEDFKEGMEVLNGYFSKKQCRLIEACFEKRYNNTPDGEPISDEDVVRIDNFNSFGRRRRNDTERAVAIFTNIIKHKGEFKP